MSTLTFEHLQIIQQLKDASLESYDSFIEKIINEQENIKHISNVLTRNDSKHMINMIKSQTIFASFYINSWNDFINKVNLNKMVRDSINSSVMPSNKKLDLLVDTFDYCFNISLPSSVLHFLSTSTDNYIIFLLSKFIKQSNKSLYSISRKLHFSNEETRIVNVLNKKLKTVTDNQNFNIEYDKIIFAPFKNAEGWKLTQNTYFYKDTKIFSIAECYDGMGYYIILSASLHQVNKYKPYFFRLEGGSDYTEVDNNKCFYETNNPPNHKMFTLKQALDFIENNNYRNKIFTY
jgi:hypothetical protein